MEENHAEETEWRRTLELVPSGVRSDISRRPIAVLTEHVAAGEIRVAVYDVAKCEDPILNKDQKDATSLELR